MQDASARGARVRDFIGKLRCKMDDIEKRFLWT